MCFLRERSSPGSSFGRQVLTFGRTLLVSKAGLEHAKSLVAGYKQGQIKEMNGELWKAKKIVDSTLHPGRCCGDAKRDWY